MQPQPGAPRGQAAAARPPPPAGPPSAAPVHNFSPTPSFLLLPTPLSMKPLASPEQATLAFAPTQWEVAGMQGGSNGPANASMAAPQEAAGALPSCSLRNAEAAHVQETGGGGTDPPAQPAAQPDAQDGTAEPAAANGSAPLEPILRALEMLSTQSQQAQHAAQRGQPELAVPPLPPRLTGGRGGRGPRSERSSSMGPAAQPGSPLPGIAAATGPVGGSSLAGSGGSGLLTPRAAAPAIPPFSTPAAAGSVQVAPSPVEPSPLALPALVAASAAAEAAAPAAAAKSRSRSRQQRRQQQDQQAEAAAKPPKPLKGRQAKRRKEQQDGEQEPRKRQRQRTSKAAPAVVSADPEQPSADRPATPSALPSDPRLPLYDSASAQGSFHYTFGRSLLFELPPPAPPLELPNLRTTAAAQSLLVGSAAAAAAPPSPQPARARPQPAVAAGPQAAAVVKDESAALAAGQAEGRGQKSKRQRQRVQADKGRQEAAGVDAAAEFAPFAVSPPADNKDAPFSMRSMKFKGVYRMPNGRWRAQFTHRNKVIQVGMYDEEEEAARAWDRAAIQYRGLGTKINIPVSQSTMAGWAKEKPVGWSLFYDDNDQPLPQPLAGAALQAKQREVQQKAAASSKGKQDSKPATAVQGGSSTGVAAGGKRAAGKQQGGKAAGVAAPSKAGAAGRPQAQDATPSPPSSPTAARAARAAHEAAHPAAASARLAASPQPRPTAPTSGHSLAALARAASSAATAAAEAGPAEAGHAAAPPATPEAVVAAGAGGAGTKAAQPAAASAHTIPATALGPPASSLPAPQPVSRAVVGWESQPGPLAYGQPAIVVNQMPPVLVTSQRFLPSSATQAVAGGASGRSTPQAERAQPKPTAAAKPMASRQRAPAPKRTRREEGGGRRQVQPAGAAVNIAQRARPARRPAARTLEALSGSDFSETEGDEPVAASRARRGGGTRQRSRPQRGLDSSLIAAVAAAEAAEAAAAARKDGGFSQLPPVATGTPAAAAAAAELGTPTGAGAAGTPLSPGRPPHRSRKKAAHPAAEAFAFSPFLEIEVPAPLQESGEAEEEEWGGEEGMALDEEWGPAVGRRRKQRGRSGQSRGLHGSPAAPSAPAQPPPMTMNLRGWSAKRQRTMPELP